MRTDELIDRHPVLHHVAAHGSWPSIQRHGLLPTGALCDMFDVDAAARERIVRAHRPDQVTIDHPDHGTAVIRDQKPMHPTKLDGLLIDITPADWYELLNSQVFFWPNEQRRDSMLNARAYRAHTHDGLVIDTAALVNLAGDRIRLSRINSGATFYDPPPRGRDLFVPLADYPRRAFAELTVPGGVPDISTAVVAVERRRGDEVVSVLMDRR